jgi:hypothetical protein
MTQASPVTKVAELYGLPTFQSAPWPDVAKVQECPFLGRKCLKNRKSDPRTTIGTCTMLYGRVAQPVMICPFRLLERRQIFTDCVHLLGLHEPGNELRVVSELIVPGGSVDYCLVSLRDGKPRDFVGIELQTLDTTGTVWPHRQRFLGEQLVKVKSRDAKSDRTFGINWKMTAKTTLVQLNHKIATFEHLSKRLVLVLQDYLLDYMRHQFSFERIRGVRDGDSMQFHAYELRKETRGYSLVLKERVSTDAAGVAACLGLRAETRVDLAALLAQIEAKSPQSASLAIGEGPVPVSPVTDVKADDAS